MKLTWLICDNFLQISLTSRAVAAVVLGLGGQALPEAAPEAAEAGASRWLVVLVLAAWLAVHGHLNAAWLANVTAWLVHVTARGALGIVADVGHFSGFLDGLGALDGLSAVDGLGAGNFDRLADSLANWHLGLHPFGLHFSDVLPHSLGSEGGHLHRHFGGVGDWNGTGNHLLSVAHLGHDWADWVSDHSFTAVVFVGHIVKLAFEGRFASVNSGLHTEHLSHGGSETVVSAKIVRFLLVSNRLWCLHVATSIADKFLLLEAAGVIGAGHVYDIGSTGN